jgi:hypothetical protein
MAESSMGRFPTRTHALAILIASCAACSQEAEVYSTPDLAPAGSSGDSAPPFNPDAGASTPPTSSGLPIIFSFHLEAKTARECTAGFSEQECADDAEWQANVKVLDRLIDKLGAHGLKGTFQHQIQWLQRLEQSEEGKTITTKMIQNGHEIALHHHGWDHGDPDGYTDTPGVSGNKFVGTMDDYLDWVHGWELRWSYQLVTIEGTDLNAGDNRPEWIYRTSDDHNNVEAEALDDGGDECGYSDGTGKPAWLVVALPSQHRGTGTVTSVGHTYFGKGKTGTAACQSAYAAHILRRTEQILARGPKANEAINMVLHPDIDYGFSALTGVYDQFFADVSALSGIVGMTVRDYSCQRAAHCEE